MSVRARMTHTTSEGRIPLRVDLFSPGYVGPIHKMIGTGPDWFDKEYENLSNANIYSSNIQFVRATLSVFVRDEDDQQVIDEILAGSFQMRFYADDIQVWRGDVLKDLITNEEVGFPRKWRIVAKDLSILEQTLFPLEDNRQPISQVLGRILSATGYGLQIRSVTDWVHGNMDAGQDFLRNTYIDTIQLRVFAGDNFQATGRRLASDEDQPITMLEALNLILRNYHLVLKQYYFFEVTQLSGLKTSTIRTTYSSSGAFISQDTVNPVITANTANRKVIIGSGNQRSDSLKRVTGTFNHRQTLSGINLPNPVNLTSSSEETFTQGFVNDGEQTIRLIGLAQVSGYTGNEPVRSNIIIRVQRTGGYYYWNRVQNTWQASLYVNRHDMRDAEFRSPAGREGEVVYSGGWEAEINLITNFIPADADGVVQVILQKGAVGTITQYRLSFELTNQDDYKNSQSVGYELVNGSTARQNFNAGQFIYGDGPTLYSTAAHRHSTSQADLISAWGRRGETINRSFADIWLSEPMDMYRTPRNMLMSQWVGLFPPVSGLLGYRNSLHAFIGGNFNGYSGRWAVNWVDNIHAGDEDDFSVNILARPANITAGLLTAISASRNDTIEAEGLFPWRLAVQASGTVSQLFVRDEADPVFAKAGWFVRVTNPVTAQTRQFRVASDQVGTVINVEPVTLEGGDSPEVYIEGSYVHVSGSTMNAGIAIADNAVRIFAEQSALAQLAQSVDGRVTSLNVKLFAQVRSGEIAVLANTLTGQDIAVQWAETVNPDGEAQVVAIREQVITAPSGSYILQSGRQQQAYVSVDPGAIINAVESFREEDAIARLTSAIFSGTYTTVSPIERLTGGDYLLPDGMRLYIAYKNGVKKELVVDGNQTLTGATDSITVQEYTIPANAALFRGAKIMEPSFASSGRITVLGDRIVLATDSNGNIATIELASGTVGSAINIRADQINMNNVIFTRGAGSSPGNIRSSNYASGTAGWRIHGDGSAEFMSVAVYAGSSTVIDENGIKSGTGDSVVWLRDNGMLIGGTAYASGTATTYNRNGIWGLGSVGQPFGVSWQIGFNTFTNKIASDVPALRVVNSSVGNEKDSVLIFADLDSSGNVYLFDDSDTDNLNSFIVAITANPSATNKISVVGNATFSGTVTVGNATSGGHALNRTTGDGLYLRAGTGSTQIRNNEQLDTRYRAGTDGTTPISQNVRVRIQSTSGDIWLDGQLVT